MTQAATVSLVHLGCARNLIDSELILARMAEQGLMVSGETEGSDACVLNTCSFIGPAREESEAAIRDLLTRKERGQIGAVVVAGCLVQRYRRRLMERFPGVDLFAEISDYRELAVAVADLVKGQRVPRYLDAHGLRAPEMDGARLLSTPGSYAYLRISHGCDHTCSFCAIPSIRGPHRSKTIAALEEETTDLIARGIKEIVLVAEDSTAWGRDLGQELPDLVERLADLDGDHRLRVMYAYPNRFPWGLTPLLRDHPRVIPYLDIPVQHVATGVLRGMQRAGSGDQVRKILDRLLDEVPDITLRTTLLVGFPGESDADVQELIEFVRGYRLARLGVFPFSPEDGTPGGDLPDRIAEKDIEARRLAVLEERDRQLRLAQEEHVGSEIEILVDEIHHTRAVARTAMDAPEVDLLCVLENPEGLGASGVQVGDRLKVKVDGIDEECNLLASLPGAL